MIYFCLQRLSEEIGSHGPEVEKALKALSELCGHDKLLETGPVEQYRQELKQQWDSLCHEVCCNESVASL